VKLYSRNGLKKALAALFSEGCGASQVDAIIKVIPAYPVPGRKHPMYDMDDVRILLQSSARVPRSTEEQSLHRRRRLKSTA